MTPHIIAPASYRPAVQEVRRVQPIANLVLVRQNYISGAVPVLFFCVQKEGEISLIYLRCLQPLAQSGRENFVSIVLSAIVFPAQAISAYPIVFGQTLDSPSPPPYQHLRYEEDYSYLYDITRRTEPLDVIKYIHLNDKGDRYLSIGGEARERYEYYHNPTWGQEPQDDNGYLLQRYMLHADLHVSPYLRLFSQLKSGLENGRTGGPRPTDEDKLDLHQIFLDAVLGLGNNDSFTLRAGRQELAYGSSRLVSTREGPNVRQSFDGLRSILHAGTWRVDGFVTRPVETNSGIFEDGTDYSRVFWGIYAVRPLSIIPKGNIDLYYLGLDRENAQFDQGIANELRHSLGTRLWGQKEAWDYNFEFVYQFGSFGEGNIQAWTAASYTGYTIRQARYQPRFSLKADITSGDRNPSDQGLQTFNPLFPRGAYFGEIALIGPANHIDVHPSVELQVTEKITFTMDWDFFWRESTRDGLYGNAVNLVRTGQTSDARYIGNQPLAQVEWRIDRHVTLTTVYAHFFAGQFLEESGPGKDVDYFSTWMTYKF